MYNTNKNHLKRLKENDSKIPKDVLEQMNIAAKNYTEGKYEFVTEEEEVEWKKRIGWDDFMRRIGNERLKNGK
jgi:hypothetical protein